MNIYKKYLLSREKKIGVWGTGYIGLSTMAYFAREKIESIGYDVDPKKVDDINKGNLPIKELREWFGFGINDLVDKKLIKATGNYRELISHDIIVHFIAIPTEKNGKPFFEILIDVLNKLSEYKNIRKDLPPLIIVESTLTPKTSERIIISLLENKGLNVGKDILLAVAPRRDWFVDGGKSLKDLDRIYGATDDHTAEISQNVLGIVCNKLHRASNYRVSEMVKSIENAYRHMEITLANQLSIAYPDENMREVLKLVGTKWNIGTFYPGFGTGGYCIPLSSQYVIQEVNDQSKLTILRETIKTDNEINILIARTFIKKRFRNIGVLGLSYKGNLKVSILSPIIPFVKEIKKNGINIKLFDPHFSNDEVKKIADVDSFSFPEGLSQFDAIVISVDHKEFFVSSETINNHMKNCKYVLDNLGIWRDLNLDKLGIEYHVSGEANWLG